MGELLPHAPPLSTAEGAERRGELLLLFKGTGKLILHSSLYIGAIILHSSPENCPIRPIRPIRPIWTNTELREA
jgi:hypothetical protein